MLVVEKVFAVATTACEDEKVLELLTAQAALVDTDQRLAHTLVRLDVRIGIYLPVALWDPESRVTTLTN